MKVQMSHVYLTVISEQVQIEAVLLWFNIRKGQYSSAQQNTLVCTTPIGIEHKKLILSPHPLDLLGSGLVLSLYYKWVVQPLCS